VIIVVKLMKRRMLKFLIMKGEIDYGSNRI